MAALSTSVKSQNNQEARAAGPPCMNKIDEKRFSSEANVEELEICLCGRLLIVVIISFKILETGEYTVRAEHSR
jgi:hypothetical protein